MSYLGPIGYSSANTRICSVVDHGANGDGKALNTAAFQKAGAACVKHGGGTVVVPAGVYRTGPIQLQSNVTLQLEAGAVLRASEVIEDHREGGRLRPLIWAQDAENIAVCGRGMIDGRGTAFVRPDQPRTVAGDFDPSFTRQGARFMSPEFGTSDGPVTFRQRLPRLIRFGSCRNVLLRDVVLKDASIWTIHLDDCEQVDIRGLKVLNNPLIPNNDGIIQKLALACQAPAAGSR